MQEQKCLQALLTSKKNMLIDRYIILQSPTMEEQMFQQIAIMSKLDAINDSPTICAIGAQNVGKSTILNAILKMNIFPSRRAEDKYNGAKTTMQVTVTNLPDPHNSILIKQGVNEAEYRFTTKEEMLTKVYNVLNNQQTNGDVLHKTMQLAEEPINLTIRSPGLLPFHFTDTPGIVSNDINKHKATSHIVERSIVNKTNTVILFFINSGDDWANTPGWNLVNRSGVCRENVVVVFTKPDTAPANGKGIYESMQQGLDWVVSSNVFLVKGPDTSKGDDLILSNEEEMHFFNGSSPYYTRLAKECPNRVGVSQLVNFLGTKLKNLSTRAVPNIIRTTQEELASFKYQYGLLGPVINTDTRVIITTKALLEYSKNLRDIFKNTKLISLNLSSNDKQEQHIKDTKLYLKTTYKEIESGLYNAIPSYTPLNDGFWSFLRDLIEKTINYNHAESEILRFLHIQHSYSVHNSTEGSYTLIVKAAMPAIVYSHLVEPLLEINAINKVLDNKHNYDMLISKAVEKPDNIVKRRDLQQYIDEREKIISVLNNFIY